MRHISICPDCREVVIRQEATTDHRCDECRALERRLAHRDAQTRLRGEHGREER